MGDNMKNRFSRRQFLGAMGAGAGMMAFGKIELALAVAKPKGETIPVSSAYHEIGETDDIYLKMAKVLDTLPQGFPKSDTGVELKILKFIFTPEEADLFCDLRITWETAAQVAERTGRAVEGLEGKLLSMAQRGEIWIMRMNEQFMFRIIPWAIGIYELSTYRMDEKLATMNEEYLPTFVKDLFGNSPSLVKTLPIQESLPSGQKTMPYQTISDLLDKQQSFILVECHCKKQKGLVGEPCTRPSTNTCIGLSPIPGHFETFQYPGGKVMTREETRARLTWAEENALVHTINNYQEEHFFICNCCSCCCGMIKSVNEVGVPAWDAYNADFYSVIDKDKCVACGLCKEERCQVNAISEGDEHYTITPKKCIGCSLCTSTCPEEAISLVAKPKDIIRTPPRGEKEWLEERAKFRGVDHSKFV